MTQTTADAFTNAALCIAPLVVLPIAGVTMIGGSCSGIRSTWHGVALFATAVAGMCCVILGWLGWFRLGPMSVAIRLARIASCVAGLGVFVLNLLFAFGAGMELVGIVVSRINRY